jgi:hypothetical protein
MMEASMKHSSMVAAISTLADDIDTACRLKAREPAPGRRRSSRVLIGIARNSWLAIVISIFFAVARGPAGAPAEAKGFAVVAEHVAAAAGAPDGPGGSIPSVNH